MQPQEQPIPGQPVYYVPVQAVSAPPAPAPAAVAEPTDRPRWVGSIEDRMTGHTVLLVLLAMAVLGNLILTFILFRMIDSALHPFS